MPWAKATMAPISRDCWPKARILSPAAALTRGWRIAESQRPRHLPPPRMRGAPTGQFRLRRDWCLTKCVALSGPGQRSRRTDVQPSRLPRWRTSVAFEFGRKPKRHLVNATDPPLQRCLRACPASASASTRLPAPGEARSRLTRRPNRIPCAHPQPFQGIPMTQRLHLVLVGILTAPAEKLG